MPPSLQQSRSAGAEDMFFEPLSNPDVNLGHIDPAIKQDAASDDGFPRASIEDLRSKSWIGAYRGSPGGLPAEKGFPIQIGSELFRLSGASIMSDAPSYFSKFFEEQIKNSENVHGSVRTLYIDRDPETFRDIARHLQGYHIQPRDGQHYVRLFGDAQFYSLPRLNKQLFDSEIFIQIGERDFKIPKDIFSSPGDSPNFFSLGFGMFFNHPQEPYPGLDRDGLIRPPPVEAPRVQGRSASTFADLLQLLRGYPLRIRNQQHRAELLRDCRYYHLKGLEQKLIYHDISFNPERQKHEITVRIEDLRQPGISFQLDDTPTPETFMLGAGWIQYARPYADDNPHDLIVEIGDGSTRLDLSGMRVEFFNQIKSRVASFLQVIGNKISSTYNTLPPLKIEATVRSRLGPDTYIVLDGEALPPISLQPGDILSMDKESEVTGPATKKRKISELDAEHRDGEWIINKAQWRIQVLTIPIPGNAACMNVLLHAVRIDAVSGQRGRNRARGFLVE